MTPYTKEIQSLQHPTVKHLVKLRREKGYRAQCQTFLIEGKKMVFECPLPIKTLLIEKGAEIPKHLKAETTLIITKEILEKMSGTKTPEPYLAEIPFPTPSSLKGKQKLLALDRIADPGNVGTLIRTALALGFDGVFLTIGSADPFMDKALRASKGATLHLPIHIGSEEELRALIAENHLTPYIADSRGQIEKDFTVPLILILGSESHGPTETLKKMGTLISIPITKQTESLNVAVAGGILMNKIQEMTCPKTTTT
ncbi:MAG: RNA methyltransferase [Chlamydiia bacterium]|nr:RNA methyltransferase [Chlamydiia bacterium]MCB1114826.1 RNA methyltransferase [Chlamydiia bacterium]